MKRREFIKKATLTTAGAFVAPYILPSGRLFAPSGARKANHVVFVLFGGGIRNQESVGQKYLLDQGRPSSGNIMNNMLTGAAPTSNIVYNPWAPIVSSSLQSQGVLFKEMRYTTGPTGHYNGHTVAMTGNYTATGLNLNVNPADPTIFEYYRKHNSPAQTALNAWWLSEGLGPYPSLNYSQHENYGASYGANYLCPSNFITGTSLNNFNNASAYQPDDVTRIEKMKGFLNFLNRKNRQSYFIYGGFWKADYCYPKGISENELYGSSTNQTMINSSAKKDLEVDDFVFLRPHQSEFVFLQFGKILTVRNGKINGTFSLLSQD